MGDVRFRYPYDELRQSPDRTAVLRRLSDEEVVEALAAASQKEDPFLANVLATEAKNRVSRLRASLKHMAEGVVALSLELRVQWMNPAAERILGWTVESALGCEISAIIDHRDASDGPLRGDASLLERPALYREVTHGEAERVRLRDGRAIFLDVTGAPILGPDADAIGAVLAFHDCTSRVQQQHELRVSRERFKSLFDLSPFGILSVSTDGVIMDCNRAAERLTGRPIEESRGKPFKTFLHPDDVAEILRLFESVTQGEWHESTLRVRHADGRHIPFHAQACPIVVDGRTVGVHGIFRPVPTQ